MLVFLNGTDPYLAKKAIDDIKAKYLQKNSGTELIEIDGEGAPLGNFADLQAVPLFATSRLVIIRQAGSLKKDVQTSLASFLNHLPATTVVVIWDGQPILPESELGISLKSAGKVINTSPLSPSVLRPYLKKYASALGLTIDSETIEALISSWGDDLWALTGEINRLSLGGETAKSGRSVEGERFAYFRLIKSRNWSGIKKELRADLERGAPIELTVGMLAAAIRKELATGLEKEAITELMIDLDYGLKTGWLDGESVTALLIAHLPKPGAHRVVWERAWEGKVS